MSFCRLFYGPNAKTQALAAFEDPPLASYGERGLSVGDAREAVHQMLWTPIGQRESFVLLGPIDKANQKSLDVLLKKIEEYKPPGTAPVLWASTIEGVPPTILSRCLLVWSPGEGTLDETKSQATSILQAIPRGDLPAVVRSLKEASGSEDDLVQALAQEALETSAPWEVLEMIRALATQKTPTHLEVLTAISDLSFFHAFA